MKSGEFAAGDAKLAARLAHTACVRYCHPRLMYAPSGSSQAARE